MEQRSPRVRIWSLVILTALWTGAVLARLGYLQLACHTDYVARAQRQQQRVIEISPKRGILYDRNLRELGMSIAVDSCFAIPAEIANPELAARLLSGVLGTPASEIEEKLRSGRSFVWIARKLPPEKAQLIRVLNLRGIYFQKENQRFYPQRELAAHVLGYVDIDERGLAGIEYSLDSEIRGRPGRMLVLADARRRWCDRSEQPADAGASVVLTLDETIQYIAEKELAAAIQQTHAPAGTVVVQDPNTGELLAVANWPPFDPGSPAESPAESRMNRAVTAAYEPGSTFKIVTLAAALEEGITRPEEVIDCQMGAIYIAGHRIRDHKPFGLLPVSQILAYSSDVGAIKIGLRLGAPKFYDYIRAFGFGEPTGIELPGENHGLLRSVESWSAISIGAVSMGQEVSATPVQIASAVSVIANGGLLHHPRVVRELRRDGQVVHLREDAPRRVIRPTTAATLRRLLEGVVLEGTGKRARLDGYTAAGKTGTAQKIDPATGRYSHSKFVASFVGFAPLNNPAVTILVLLDSPVGQFYGGDVAAPVFKRVAEQVLTYLDVPHDVAVPLGEELAAKRQRKREAPPDVGDFEPDRVEAVATVTLQLSSPGSSAPEVGPALAEGDGIEVPRLAGKSVRSVTEKCLRLGLQPVLIGTGIAIEQTPEAGVRVQRGSRVIVQFARWGTTRAAADGGN